jgi:glycosyltransferase involved in cell wall biosynthesis
VRVLFVARLFPYPPDGGAKIKSYHMVRCIGQAHDLTVVTFVRWPRDRSFVADLEGMCSKLVTVEMPRSRVRDAWLLGLSLLGPLPFMVRREMNRTMQQAVSGLLNSRSYDAAHFDHVHMAPYALDSFRPKILDTHNAEWVTATRLAEAGPTPAHAIYARIEAAKTKRFELATVRRFDRVVTVTDVDRDQLGMSADSPQACTIPIPVLPEYDVEPFADYDPNLVAHAGTMYYPPNVDGAVWTCAEIFPHIRKSKPDAKLLIIGMRPTRKVWALASLPGVTVMEGGEDMIPHLRRCAILLAPLRSGSGMRVKIVNSFAMGVPVVSTTVGCEGLPVEDGVHLLIADDPAEFAAKTVRLMDDRGLRRRLIDNGKELVKRLYTPEAIYPQILDLYDGLRRRAA